MTAMRLLAAAQPACVPPTVSVKVSQLTPSMHVLSPFAAPVPVAVPTQLTGDAVGLAMVPDAGFADRDVVVKSANTTRKTPITKKSAPMVARAVIEEEIFFIGKASIKCFALRIVEMANCGRLLSAARARKVAVYSSFAGKKLTLRRRVR